MGELIKTFTYPRNALARTSTEAAQKAIETIDRARGGVLLRSAQGKGIKDEAFNDARAFLGTVGGEVTAPQVLDVGLKYEELHARSPSRAWDWLLTRSMWLWSLPNATQAQASRVAADSNLNVNFFDLVLRTLHHLEFMPGGSTLHFEELLPVLDQDDNWAWSPLGVAPAIMQLRIEGPVPTTASARPLLDDLESEYGVPRDNLAGVFGKALGQSSLFKLVLNGDRQAVGISLNHIVRQPGSARDWLEFVLRHPKAPKES